ncbi:MAG: hypothetical protein MUD01_03035 [Chloroflexaceae bacterium]|jgi:hypothetical protein|nr:hypothetical protein [Chloroflexaceae bacterium]
MMQRNSSIPDMVRGMMTQSLVVLQNPSVSTFERYERSGTAVQAAIYVGLAALITGLLGIFSGGIGAVVANVISTLIGFFIFTGLVYYIGQAQGGTGKFDEVAYTFSLFWAPLAVLVSLGSLVLTITIIGVIFIPLLALVGLLASAYFAYLSVQSSMNLFDQTRILITLGGAVIGTMVLRVVLGFFGI